MREIKLVIEYDGTNFVGWQTQQNGRSVQEEITKVLDQVLQEPISLIGAGRTDSGVHARGQVAGFRTKSVLGVGSMHSALNGILPDDIYVRSVEEAPAGFHARYDARERLYRYYIVLTPSAIGRMYHWYVKYDLNVQAMNAIAGQILGDQDFEAFCKHEAEVNHYRCTVNRSEWIPRGDELIYEIRANRFLHGMVRALVGTMVDVGRGYTPVEDFAAILASKDRRKAGMAAPPLGLFLEEVTY
jgi:tRNA pseudouridine38-40 synthase